MIATEPTVQFVVERFDSMGKDKIILNLSEIDDISTYPGTGEMRVTLINGKHYDTRGPIRFQQ